METNSEIIEFPKEEMKHTIIVTLKEQVFVDERKRVFALEFDCMCTDEMTPSGLMEFCNTGKPRVAIPIHNVLAVVYKYQH